MKHTYPILGQILALLRLGWPIMLAQLLQLSMVVVDNLMIGHLGAVALAGMALASIMIHFVFIFAIGVLSAISPMAAHAFGEQNWPRYFSLARHGLCLAAGLTLFCMASFYFAHDLLTLLGQAPETTRVATRYLQVFTWSMPAQIGFVYLRQLVEATGKTKVPLYASLMGALTNAWLDYLLIFGNLGLPRWEIAGAALATTVASYLMCGTLLLYYLCRIRKRYKLHDHPAPGKWQLRIIGEMLRLGLPLGGMWVCEVSYFSGAGILMGWIGNLELAAHQIALNIASFVFMVPLGLSIATTIRVGHALGEQQLGQVVSICRASYGLTLMLMLVPALCFATFPHFIVSWYSQDHDLLTMASRLLMIAGAFQLFDGLQVVGVGILRGLKDSRVPFFSTMIAFWMVGIPLSYLMAFKLHWGAYGIWLSMIIGLFTAALLHYLRFRYLLRQLGLKGPGDGLGPGGCPQGPQNRG